MAFFTHIFKTFSHMLISRLQTDDTKSLLDISLFCDIIRSNVHYFEHNFKNIRCAAYITLFALLIVL